MKPFFGLFSKLGEWTAPPLPLRLRISSRQWAGRFTVVLCLIVVVSVLHATTYRYKPDKDVCGAAANGDLKAVEAFVLAHPESIRETDLDWTPLHWAARYHRVRVAGFLLKNGAAVNAVGRGGFTPLHAVMFSGVEMTILLIDHGGDPNALTEEGVGVVCLACRAGADAEVVRLLLKAGADPNIKPKNGATVLQEAAFRSPPSVLVALLDGGTDINQIGFEGATALHWAIHGDNLEAAMFLAERGADGTLGNKYGTTALKAAGSKVDSTLFRDNLRWKRVVRLLSEQARHEESRSSSDEVSPHDGTKDGATKP